MRTACLVRWLALLALTAPARAQRVPPGDEQLRSVALRVADLDHRRQWTGATMATVDSLLALYADSVVYEHPSVGAVVRGKAALRAGMERYLGSRPPADMPQPRVVIGPGVVILELPAGPDPRDPSRPVPPTRRALRVLEFDADGLVRRILDYPW